MLWRNGWMIFWDGGICLDLKHLWVQYDFNKVQLCGRGRKELPIIRMWKLWQNLVCRNRFNLHDAKPLLSEQYFLKPMKVLNKENRASHAKYDFCFFPKCVNMPDINALWKKNIFFFKVSWLGTKFNALWNFFSKCVLF